MTTATATTSTATTVAASEIARPLLRRARFWLVLAVVVLIGAIALTLTSSTPGRALDPDSASHGGSQALSRLLDQRGTRVHRTTSLTDAPAGATVVLAVPDDYTEDQLRALADGRRLVVPASNFALGVLASGLQIGPTDDEATTVAPGCDVSGAQAAGPVRFPADTETFSVAQDAPAGECYGGRVLITKSVVVIGTSALLTNARLADTGVAALDLNVITADGTVADVYWILPGADAAGEGSPSIWQLLPGWTPRATVWLLVLGVLVMIWRSRRMGPVVFEPLPVVVRAAEVVEGHGRLYRRAHARETAAATLRQASRGRLARLSGLPPVQSPADLEQVVATSTGQSTDAVNNLLAGPVPTDDDQLAELARALSRLEHQAGREGQDARS